MREHVHRCMHRIIKTRSYKKSIKQNILTGRLRDGNPSEHLVIFYSPDNITIPPHADLLQMTAQLYVKMKANTNIFNLKLLSKLLS